MRKSFFNSVPHEDSIGTCENLLPRFLSSRDVFMYLACPATTSFAICGATYRTFFVQRIRNDEDEDDDDDNDDDDNAFSSYT